MVDRVHDLQCFGSDHLPSPGRCVGVMDDVALGVWRSVHHRRKSAGITVVELQQILEIWLNHVGGGTASTR